MDTIEVDGAEYDTIQRLAMEEVHTHGVLTDSFSNQSITQGETPSLTRVKPAAMIKNRNKKHPILSVARRRSSGKAKTEPPKKLNVQKAPVSSSRRLSQRNGIHKRPYASSSNSGLIHDRLSSMNGDTELLQQQSSGVPQDHLESIPAMRDTEARDPVPNATSQTVRKFIVGIDYGTTFTSVSYYAHPVDEPHPNAFPDEVKSIQNWPKDTMHTRVNQQVPSESWYPRKLKARPKPTRQYDTSESDDSDSDDESNNQRGAQLSKFNSSPAFNNTDLDKNYSSQMDCEESDTYIWGYDVRYQRNIAHTNRHEERLVRCPKLMLVESEHTEEDRTLLRRQIDYLIEMDIIRKYGKRDMPSPRDVQDLIADFLTYVLYHTKRQLILNEGLTPDCPVSFVLDVPAVWSANSSRVLQIAMETAIKASGLGKMKHGSVDNLFIVSEPEAAATYLLANSNNMIPSDNFVVLDCGGGTVDAVTYTITNSYPLRLDHEVVRPAGDNCGGNYLNLNFEEHLLDRLRNEDYLDTNGNTREAIVKDLVVHFEDYDKRMKDITLMPSGKVKIPGLKGDKREGRTGSHVRRFEDNFLLLNHHDYNTIFLPILERVGAVLRDQLDGAMLQGKEIKKVFLVGGFGAAPSLRSYLRQFVREFVDDYDLNYDIELIEPNDEACVTAVASGAVLRDMNKDGGPERFTFSSYGFLRGQHYEPRKVAGHRAGQPYRDKHTGEEYISVIDYFMSKCDRILPIQRYDPIKCFHRFDINCKQMLCEEILYVSDHATRSNFPSDGEENRDAQVAGKITVNMTFLRDKGIILPTLPSIDDGVLRGEAHYEVEYDIIPIVEGRNLRYEAQYTMGNTKKLLGTGQISIAAAFKPGTG